MNQALERLVGTTAGFMRQAIDPSTGFAIKGEWQAHQHSPRYSCAQAGCEFAASERSA